MPCLMTKQYSKDDSIAERDSESIHSGDFDQVASFEALMRSTSKCLHGVKWKDTPAAYSLNEIEENLRLEKQLEKGTYKQRRPPTIQGDVSKGTRYCKRCLSGQGVSEKPERQHHLPKNQQELYL